MEVTISYIIGKTRDKNPSLFCWIVYESNVGLCMKQTNRHGYFFFLPATIFYTLIVLLPVFMTIAFSLFKWDRFDIKSFFTLDNYIQITKDPLVTKAFFNNAMYMLYTLISEGLLGLALAGFFVATKKPNLILRSIIFSPIVLPSIVVGVLGRAIFATKSGLVNTMLVSLGLDPVVWLGGRLSILTISLIDGWIFAGLFMTIFYTGLIGVPKEIVEAGELDGLSKFKIFCYIQLPLIKRHIMVVIIIIVTGAFKGFDLFQIIFRRDPLSNGLVVGNYLVKIFFEQSRIGYGSAIATILTVVVLFILYIFGKIMKKIKDDE